MKNRSLKFAALALVAFLGGCATLDKWAAEAEMKRRAEDNEGQKIMASSYRLKQAVENGMRANDYTPSTVSTGRGADKRGYVITGKYSGMTGKDIGEAFLGALTRGNSKDTAGHKYRRSEKVVRAVINAAWNRDLSKAEPGKAVMRLSTLTWDVDTKGETYNVQNTDDEPLMKEVRGDMDMYMKAHPEGKE